MENSQTMRLTNDIASLASLNKHNQNYVKYAGSTFDERAVSKDFQLLLEFSKAYRKSHHRNRPNIGDCLRLPDGQIVYFCHIYDDRAQTCECGSFHLSNSGYINYSGGLDSGISFNNIELTNDKWVLPVWISHRGILCGGCAIHAHIECRVWQTKEGADLSGIPQVKRLRKKKLKEQSETITNIDGNGNHHMEHLPEIIIRKTNLSAELFQIVQKATGLDFEDDYYYVPVYWCQPLTLKQIEKLKQFLQFNFREDRDIINYAKILVFEIKS